jgi:GTP diphosphokinase / guanosine-3',5'-bis(diphosphate) 3'-diphosphatase
MDLRIEDIIDAAKNYLPNLDSKRMMAAYDLAEKAHEGQVRYSGDPYISHLLASTNLLLPLKPDEDTLLAALLHDVPEDTAHTLSEIEKKIGKGVSDLVHGVGKLSLVRVQKGQPEVESWRKMFLAMAKDLRVVFIKLADRLHNMQTLEYVAKDKQLRIAEETLRVYAPIASRLGIYAMKGPLEDLCFKHLHPKEYKDLKAQVDSHGRVDPKYIGVAQDILSDFLKEEGIEGEITGRVKHLYSIHQKLKRKNLNSIDNIYDLFAMRIVLPDQHREGREFLGHCYTTLGAIHNSWTPMSGRFKDYIAVPKINGYRSLHTTVIGKTVLKNHPVELQIRTRGMNQEAEYGIASHWWYKDGAPKEMSFSRHDLQNILYERRLFKRFHDLLEKHIDKRKEFEHVLSRRNTAEVSFDASLRTFLKQGGFIKKEINDLEAFLTTEVTNKNEALKFFKHHVDWLYGLERLQEDLQQTPDESDSMDVNVFTDRIFALTPHGDVKDLPQGATPVDFAYSIHSDIGDRCAQAKVNAGIVSLDYKLQSGDVVEILTKKHPAPNRYWLSFVKTSHAKTRIKAWFRSQDREKNIKLGREIINKELRRLSKPLLGPNLGQLKHYGGAKRLSFADRENMVELIGNGSMHVGTLIRNLFSEKELMEDSPPPEYQPEVEAEESVCEDKVLITGQSDLPVILSACCKPRFPDSIVGYVTRGSAIRVHKKLCYQVGKMDKDRLLEATWASLEGKKKYPVRIRIEALDKVGLLRDVLGVVADMGKDVVDFPLVSKSNGKVVRCLIVAVSGYEKMSELISRLEKIEGVLSARKE